MKRFIPLALACVLLLSLAACAVTPPGEPTTTTTAPPATTEQSRRTRQPITMSREIRQDGLVLRVLTYYEKNFTGEPFTLEAAITNTTGRDITYGVGSGTPNVHLEIRVSIPGFTDLDLEGKMFDEMYKFTALQAGEAFTETIHFSPNALPAGEYEGTAIFTYYPAYDPMNPGEAKQIELKFPIILI